MKLVAWCLAFGALACWNSAAHGQDQWVFVPAVANGESLPSVKRLELAVSDPRLLSNDASAQTLEARDSSEAPKLAETEVERAIELVNRVKNAVAMPDKDKAWRKQWRELERLTPPVQDYLRRDAKRDDDLFNACVMAGGLLLTTGSPSHRAKNSAEAHEQMRTCARIYPGRTPQAAPAVLEAYNKAAAEVAAEPHGTLDVDGGNGCGVRVNGALVGTSPLHIDVVRLGTARVQMECNGSPGRIHAVGIGPGTNRVSINPAFEQALSSAGQLTLTYPDRAERERSMSRDGQRIGEILDAHVVLVVPVGPSAYRLLSLNPRAELGTLSDGAPSPVVLKAVRALMGPVVSKAQSSSSSSSSSPPSAAPEVPRPAPKRRIEQTANRATPPTADGGSGVARVVAAGMLIAAGVAGVLTAWVFYAQRLDRRSTVYVPLSYAARADYHNLGNAALWFALGGSVLLAGAEYFLLPQERGVPTSAWAWFGGGVLLAAGGVALLATQGDCTQPNPQCRGFGSDSVLGPLLALHAIPLLAVPLNYALADWLRPRRRIELGIRGGQATLSVRF